MSEFPSYSEQSAKFHRFMDTPLPEKYLLMVREHPNSYVGGVQRLYRLGSFGLSFVDGPNLHSFPFRWEVICLHWEKGANDLDFECTHGKFEDPLNDDITVFGNGADANEWLQDVGFPWMERQHALHD